MTYAPAPQFASLQTDVASFFNVSPSSYMSLFEISCSGKPEMTLQGELLFHLRERGWRCIQEAGYSAPAVRPGKSTRRNIDILVFDPHASVSVSAHPICCIELKHFSSNQGSASVLAADMDLDYLLPRPAHQGIQVPIMHVGMYTTIHTVTNPPPAKVGLHRFARSVRVPPKHFGFSSVFSSWAASRSWLITPVAVCARPAVPSAAFKLQTGETLSGWVEAFVGIRN